MSDRLLLSALFRPAERAFGLLLQIRHREEQRHDQRREELEIVRVKPQPQNERHDHVVEHAAEHDEEQLHGEVAALFEDRLAEDLADNNGRKADDDRAAAHVDVRRALKLRHQSAGERHNAVGERKADDLHPVNVDALRAAHRGVGACRAQRRALLRAEIPVEQRNEHRREQKADADRLRHIARGDKEALAAVFPEHAVGFEACRLVRLHAHDAQIHGIERELRKDTGKNAHVR